ncbi:MAG: hypothetical protein EOP08_17750, partial [Proteobacteria bacterium]
MAFPRIFVGLLLAILTLAESAHARPKVNAATDAAVGDATSKILVEEYAADVSVDRGRQVFGGHRRMSQRLALVG